MKPELLESATAVVYRLDDGRVLKVHPRSIDLEAVERMAALLDVLRSERLAVPELLEIRPELQVKTYWNDLGDSVRGTDWFAAGVLLKRVHSMSLANSKIRSLGLPNINGLEFFSGVVENHRKVDDQWNGLIDVLWGYAKQFHSQLPESELTLVHDDFWPKNIHVVENNKTWLIDWDNGAIATPNHDLALMVKHVAEGTITRGDAAFFEAGYGKKLPSLEEAFPYCGLHRIRWVLSIIARSRLGEPEATTQLEEEAPLWSKTENPVIDQKLALS